MLNGYEVVSRNHLNGSFFFCLDLCAKCSQCHKKMKSLRKKLFIHSMYVFTSPLHTSRMRQSQFFMQSLAGLNSPRLAAIVIYKALCFDVAQGQMNGAPNETRTHSCRFASQAG